FSAAQPPLSLEDFAGRVAEPPPCLQWAHDPSAPALCSELHSFLGGSWLFLYRRLQQLLQACARAKQADGYSASRGLHDFGDLRLTLVVYIPQEDDLRCGRLQFGDGAMQACIDVLLVSRAGSRFRFSFVE